MLGVQSIQMVWIGRWAVPRAPHPQGAANTMRDAFRGSGRVVIQMSRECVFVHSPSAHTPTWPKRAILESHAASPATGPRSTFQMPCGFALELRRPRSQPGPTEEISERFIVLVQLCQPRPSLASMKQGTFPDSTGIQIKPLPGPTENCMAVPYFVPYHLR